MNDETSGKIEHEWVGKAVKVRGRPDDRVTAAWQSRDNRVWFELEAGSAWQDECELIHTVHLGPGDPAFAGLRAVADAISARAREIKPLDLVTLLSGGPTMVVELVREAEGHAIFVGAPQEARCWWMDHTGNLHVAKYPVALLHLVP